MQREFVKGATVNGAILGAAWGGFLMLSNAHDGLAGTYLPDAIAWTALGALAGAAVGLGRRLIG